MFTNSHERLALCAYWICVIYVSIRRFYSISKESTTERILLRKYYHLVAVLIFSPAVIFQVCMSCFINPIRTFRDYFDQFVLCFAACFLGLGIWCSVCSFLNTGDDSCKFLIILSCSSSVPYFFSFSSICYAKFAYFSLEIMPSGLGSISSWAYSTSIHERLH
jgi:hypothetical protein